MSAPSVSVIVAMPCLIAAFEHFLQPLRRNHARATERVFWPHRVMASAELSARCVEVPPAVLTHDVLGALPVRAVCLVGEDVRHAVSDADPFGFSMRSFYASRSGRRSGNG